MLKHFNTFWLGLVIVVMCLLWFNSDWLSREAIAAFLNSLGAFAFVGYVALSLGRALFLIPCTPFVLAGAMSFPQWPGLVFAVSITGIVVGVLLVYSFPTFGGYDRFLEGKYPQVIATLKDKLHGKYAFWIVTSWSFFPLVPTDAVCYVAGMVKMPLLKLIIAVVLGELPLVTAYVFLGAGIGEWLRA